MIKFFRRIRYNLMETGKTAKYLKYAIGEILLVVIGILIALQINNWNEQRKQNKQEHYILQQLQVEFKADSAILARFTQLVSGKIKVTKNIVSAIQTSTTDTISIYPIFLVGKSVPFYDYSPTYSELVSSGTLNTISNDSIKHAINDFIHHNAQLENILYQQMSEHKEAYLEHVFNYFNGEINGLIWHSARNQNALDDLEALGANYEGYFLDRNTPLLLNNVLATESEVRFIYKNNVARRLNLVLELLNNELNK